MLNTCASTSEQQTSPPAWWVVKDSPGVAPNTFGGGLDDYHDDSHDGDDDYRDDEY